ncbi:hypothetical protein Q73A0000_02890 [Kaistella flava (ex Peng et al. 2021)]|uniref:Uncharacterized protein n=1 Tax=Kaistella flava (ex Peng et al. 2021) TaxID=2038776 RepID=A0A7M2Y556_9FLAO|nr:hypothetical protein [Kaistella flava (ex Peng et al. 2021)]QOW09378.1 hypothetical protein Q73A0000_02890 [Kaistella flava (ex Peng et al. 2021)]
MKIIKTFKFASNLEYVHSVLNEQKIIHSIDLQNLTISSEEFQEPKILKIIRGLNLDEKEVKIDENFQKDYDDWHKNSLNPGHFMGGRIPFFYWNKKNYPFLFFTIFFVPIITIIIMAFSDGKWSFQFDLVGICTFLFLVFVAVSMIVQWIKYRKNLK